MILYLFAELALGLMCGSELNVAAFAHPTLERQPPRVGILLRSSFASLFGRAMPFWMAGSTLLNLLHYCRSNTLVSLHDAWQPCPGYTNFCRSVFACRASADQ
jgi:hypothetical protein